jgi:general secretion pathway protein A
VPTSIYTANFALTRNPFALTPDPGALFGSPCHKEAIAGLTFGIQNRKGFMVLTGEAGTGKTTVLNATLEALRKENLLSAWVIHPSLNADEFLEYALHDMGIDPVPVGKTQRLIAFQQLVTETYRAGGTSVLIVDEAHLLTREVLEEIRLLSNFESYDEKMLQVILCGQEELSALLGRHDLRQLKQRVALWLELRPLSDEQLLQYIEHRWFLAGGVHPAPFTSAAMEALSAHSQGIPRVANALCDGALVVAAALRSNIVNAEDVVDVARDLRLGVDSSFLTETISAKPVGTHSYKGMELDLSLQPCSTSTEGEEDAVLSMGKPEMAARVPVLPRLLARLGIGYLRSSAPSRVGRLAA